MGAAGETVDATPGGAVRAAAFVIRCTAASVGAAMLAQALGLAHPVWACVSAMVVSQDQLGDTRRALGWRLVATLIGLTIAFLVAVVVPGDLPYGRLALAVGIAAAISRWHERLRVCMWTSAIVLTTVPPGETVLLTGWERGQEVLLGALVGALLHYLADWLILRRERRPAAGNAQPAACRIPRSSPRSSASPRIRPSSE